MIKNFKKALFCLAFFLMIEKANAQGNIQLFRLSGPDRYQTSIEISKNAFDTKSEQVVIASGEDFPDALSASNLTIHKELPLLLVEKNHISSQTIAEIKRLNPNKVYILGGPNTISTKVEDEISKIQHSIERISGTDRYETSKKAALEALYDKVESDKKSDVILASGKNFPDALSSAGLMEKRGMGLILSDGLDSNLNNYPYDKIWLCGGKNSLALDGLNEDKRIAGTDRYKTSDELLKAYVELNEGKNPETVIIVDGRNFPDALSATSLSKVYDAPIILYDNNSLNSYSRSVVNSAKNVIIVGGENSISYHKLRAIFNNP